MNIKCDRCKERIKKKAALVFSPPESLIDNGIPVDHCHKFHICQLCWVELALFVQGVSYRLIKGPKPKSSKKLRGL